MRRSARRHMPSELNLKWNVARRHTLNNLKLKWIVARRSARRSTLIGSEIRHIHHATKHTNLRSLKLTTNPKIITTHVGLRTRERVRGVNEATRVAPGPGRHAQEPKAARMAVSYTHLQGGEAWPRTRNRWGRLTCVGMECPNMSCV